MPSPVTSLFGNHWVSMEILHTGGYTPINPGTFQAPSSGLPDRAGVSTFSPGSQGIVCRSGTAGLHTCDEGSSVISQPSPALASQDCVPSVLFSLPRKAGHGGLHEGLTNSEWMNTQNEILKRIINMSHIYLCSWQFSDFYIHDPRKNILPYCDSVQRFTYIMEIRVSKTNRHKHSIYPILYSMLCILLYSILFHLYSTVYYLSLSFPDFEIRV